MGTKRDPNCQKCNGNGNGYIWDYMGGCGDPECCGGPWQIQCPYCDNDWEYGDEDVDNS